MAIDSCLSQKRKLVNNGGAYCIAVRIRFGYEQLLLFMVNLNDFSFREKLCIITWTCLRQILNNWKYQTMTRIFNLIMMLNMTNIESVDLGYVFGKCNEVNPRHNMKMWGVGSWAINNYRIIRGAHKYNFLKWANF